jgi:hypothetical protein
MAFPNQMRYTIFPSLLAGRGLGVGFLYPHSTENRYISIDNKETLLISKTEEKEFQFKPLGTYLVEAELITQNALDTALTAQKLNGKQLGEILAMHGLVKQQTIEYFMENIVLPERQKILKQLSSCLLYTSPSPRD